MAAVGSTTRMLQNGVDRRSSARVVPVLAIGDDKELVRSELCSDSVGVVLHVLLSSLLRHLHGKSHRVIQGCTRTNIKRSNKSFKVSFVKLRFTFLLICSELPLEASRHVHLHRGGQRDDAEGVALLQQIPELVEFCLGVVKVAATH